MKNKAKGDTEWQPCPSSEMLPLCSLQRPQEVWWLGGCVLSILMVTCKLRTLLVFLKEQRERIHSVSIKRRKKKTLKIC